MIQDRLGSIWKRILMYKYLMVLTLAFNVFTAASGAICSYLVWTGAFQLSQQITEQEQKNQALADFEKSIAALPVIQDKKRLTRQEAIQEIQAWEKIRLQADQLQLASFESLPEDYFVNTKASENWLTQVQLEISRKKESSRSEVLKMAQREDQLSSALIWLGFLTLVFGIAIPMIVLSLLAKALRQAQRALTESAREIVQSWSSAIQKHGEDPFKNPQFWVEVLLIFGEQMGHHSRHPGAALTSELSYLVRDELHRAHKKEAA